MVKRQRGGWESVDVWICGIVQVCVCLLQHVRAVLWFLQQPSLHDKAEHLLIRKTLVGLLCQSGDLPQYNPKWPTQEGQREVRKEVSSIINISSKAVNTETEATMCSWMSVGSCLPDIRVCSEDAIFQRLWWHPADREQTLTSFAVVICLIDVSGHAKICPHTQTQRKSKSLTRIIDLKMTLNPRLFNSINCDCLHDDPHLFIPKEVTHSKWVGLDFLIVNKPGN